MQAAGVLHPHVGATADRIPADPERLLPGVVAQIAGPVHLRSVSADNTCRPDRRPGALEADPAGKVVNA